MHLTKNRNSLTLEKEIATLNNDHGQIKNLLQEQEKHHAHTRHETTLMGFIVGAVWP